MSAGNDASKPTDADTIAALTARCAHLADNSPPILNPMIGYVDQSDETAGNVRDVLMFVADAIGKQTDLGAPLAEGARLILETCAAALDFHIDRARIAAT